MYNIIKSSTKKLIRKGDNVNFRDFNGRPSNKNKQYSNGQSFRDLYAKNTKKEIVLEEVFPPEKPVTKVTPPQMVNKNITPPVSQPINSYQQPPMYYPNNIYTQPPMPSRNMSIPQSMPINPMQNQFVNYSQPAPYVSVPQKPFIPEPPPKPPEKPDPSKFVEEYVPTPPPKMVKAKTPIRKKEDHFDNSLGSFGGTFDENPDQSTSIADIPVMNNIDDYKI